MDDYGLNWAQEEYDRQEPAESDVVGTCAYCGRDIYDGEKVYVLDNDWYCTDCVAEAIADKEGPPDEY